MPKGAVLHAHFDALADVEWLIGFATYLPNCYVNTIHPGQMMEFAFFDTPPTADGKLWLLVSNERAIYPGGPKAFDAYLHDRMTMEPSIREGIESIHDSGIWERFLSTFLILGTLLRYVPVFKQYMERKLHSLLDDGVIYIEERLVGFFRLYETYGCDLPIEQTIAMYDEAVKLFIARSPQQFFGSKLIYCGLKVVDVQTVEKFLNETLMLKRAFPDCIVGCSLNFQFHFSKFRIRFGWV
jgi:adenosine deaminase CECR1